MCASVPYNIKECAAVGASRRPRRTPVAPSEVEGQAETNHCGSRYFNLDINSFSFRVVAYHHSRSMFLLSEGCVERLQNAPRSGGMDAKRPNLNVLRSLS